MAQRGLLVRLTMCLLPLRMAVETVPVSARMRPDILEVGSPRPSHHLPSPPSLRNFFKRTVGRADTVATSGRNEISVELEVALNCSSEAAAADEQEIVVVDVTSSSSSSLSPSLSSLPPLSSSLPSSSSSLLPPLASSSSSISSSSTSSTFTTSILSSLPPSSSSHSSHSLSSSSSYYETPSPGLLLREFAQPRRRSGPAAETRGPLSQAMVSCSTRSNDAPQDREKYGNMTVMKEVMENGSLLLDKGVKMSPIGGEGLSGHETGGVRGLEGGGEEIPPRCSYMEPAPPAWSRVITDPSLLCVVNPHWLAYPPPSHLSHVIIAGLYLLIMAFGLVGNGLVIFLFISSRALRTPSNLFILNLAASDFLLVAMMAMVVHNSLLEGPAMGRVGCDLYGFVGGVTGTTSIMTLAAISFDRYLVISYPLDPFKKLSHRQVLAIILATWLYSFTFSVMPLVGLEDINYSPEGLLTTCSFDYLSESTNTRIYIFSFFVAAWVVPLNIIVFSYLSILTTVSKQERYCHTCQGTFSTSFKHQRLKRKKGVELKLTKVASGIIALWVLAWTPYAVVSLLGIFNQRAVITPLVSMIPAFFCKTAACFDPFIYALSHPRFKAELNKRVMRRRRHLMGAVRNGITQGFSVSTFSEMREEREMSDLQTWGNYDPSSSSLGPLLQRNLSCSSNPTLDRPRRREVASSPGSRSLASPFSTEVYPRKSLSTYSFRSTSKTCRLEEKLETVHKFRRPDDCQVELRTTALIELPSAQLPRRPFSLSYSFSTGLERVGLCTRPPAHVWTTTQLPFTTENDARSHSHMEAESSRKKTKNLPVPDAAVRWRTKGRSNSLPNMTYGPADRKPDGKFSKNMLLQIFQGKILHAARRNKSSSSIFQDDKKV